MQRRASGKSVEGGRQKGPGARIRVRSAIWAILGIASILASSAAAQTLSIAETETLVRAAYFEGLPEELALRVGPVGAARLAEMLGDPAESSAHANILIVLGLVGGPEAYQAITDWAARPREGEIDRDTFRAWQALPYALGHLSHHDGRAVARLEAQLDGEAPNWTFRHHRGARLSRQSRRAAATALGMTGLPAAGEALDRAGRPATDTEFDKHLRDARSMHRARAAAGPRR